MADLLVNAALLVALWFLVIRPLVGLIAMIAWHERRVRAGRYPTDAEVIAHGRHWWRVWVD